MKPLKLFLEDDFDIRMAAQKKRKADEKALESRLTSHYTHASKHSEALKDYTNSSGELNSYLWEKHKGKNPEENEDILSKIKNMDSATNAQRTPETFTVYSKSRHDPRDHMDSKGIMFHPAFLSTSIQKSVPEGQYAYRNVVRNEQGKNVHHIYKIEVPEGHPGVYVADRHSIDPKAKEFILPRGTKLQHLNTNTSESSSVIQHEHHLRVVP